MTSTARGHIGGSTQPRNRLHCPTCKSKNKPNLSTRLLGSKDSNMRKKKELTGLGQEWKRRPGFRLVHEVRMMAILPQSHIAIEDLQGGEEEDGVYCNYGPGTSIPRAWQLRHRAEYLPDVVGAI
ncbi:hypothetical protein E3N88_35934 [Mikania micrantha]|uniref:Uncharacterized protein n=1 Tax=Mikania micrantha TaxID=192012 RepID=A0A5N6M2B7_9ASTR|nr:hypothetical protein E3N88_35934 [Mikania micrantha]